MTFALNDYRFGEEISKSRREHTPAVDEVIYTLRAIITGDDFRGHTLPRPPLLYILNSTGTGKTSTVIDAAIACNCVHLHVNLALVKEMVRVVEMCPSFFVHPDSREYLARYDIIEAFSKLYRHELAGLFFACKVALLSAEFSPSTREVQPDSISTVSGLNVSDATLEWNALVGSIPSSERVVIHMDECQAVFGEHEYPHDGYLFDGSDTDRFSVSEAPCLALKSLICTLQPFVTSTRKVAWVFTGLRANLRLFLNVPTMLTCMDVGRRISYFNAESIYRVFSKYVGLDGTPFAALDQRVHRFFQRLVGPPIVIEFLLDAVQFLKISDLTDMISRQSAVVEHIKARLCSSIPGLLGLGSETLKFCCIAPLLNLNRLSVNLRQSYWADLVANGVLRVDLEGPIGSGGYLGPRDSNEMNEQGCNLVPAYPLLQSILGSMSRTPHAMVDLLSRLVQCADSSVNSGGRSSDVAFAAALVPPRAANTISWLTSLGISECFTPSVRVCFYDDGFDVKGDIDVKNDEIIHSRTCSGVAIGSNLVFEARLNLDCARFAGECVRVVVEVVYGVPESMEQLTNAISKMTGSAISLYESTLPTGRAKRTIIVLACAQMNLTERVQREICSNLIQGERFANQGERFADVGLNNPFPQSDDIASVNGLMASQPGTDSTRPGTDSTRPYALFLVGPDSPIWSEMLISVKDICNDEKQEMRMAILRKFEPEFLAEYQPGMLVPVYTSTAHRRGSISLLPSSPKPRMPPKGFVALARQTMGGSNQVVDFAERHGLTGLCFLVPEVLEYIPSPGFSATGKSVGLLENLATVYLHREGIRPPSEVSLDAGISDLISYIRQWGVPQTDAKIMWAFLMRLSKWTVENMSLRGMAGCDVALGTKLSVLAVISSIRRSRVDNSSSLDNSSNLQHADNVQQVDMLSSKRGAPDLDAPIDLHDVFTEVRKIRGIRAEAMSRFEQLFCPREPGGLSDFTMASVHMLTEVDLIKTGVPPGDARLILTCIRRKFGSLQ